MAVSSAIFTVNEEKKLRKREPSPDVKSPHDENEINVRYAYQIGDRYWDSVTKSEERDASPPAKIPRKEVDPVLTRTGGAYIPPAKLRMMQAQITDKSSLAFQRLAWEALKKSIHGLINKINISNIAQIIGKLFRENIVRARGLLSRSIMQAQAASPTFTHVYASLVAVINSKFPNIGDLILTRLIIQFRQGFKRNNKAICLSSTRFIAHLVNQQVAHELLALEILTLLLENATDDSVEVAISFLKECGQKLGEVSPRGLTAIFDSLRHVLHEADLDKRVKYMIEVMFQVRKDGFKDNPSIIEGLDLVEENDQFTHTLSVQDKLDSEDLLNVFKHDPDYVSNEEKYQAVKKEILGEDDEEGSGAESGSGSDEDESSEEEEDEKSPDAIIDETETNLVALRRTIYLTIQSSLDHNECAHKMMKMQMKPGQEMELCHMILDCCAQMRTYEKFFGLLAQRFCQINKIYVPPFEQIFKDTYDTIHRLDTNKLRNVAKLFAHLLFTDAISWQVMQHIRLTEDDTTSSSRIFLKILFQELAEYLGLPKLNLRLKDSTLQFAFDGVFPRDDPRNTRFAINFFTSIGLGGLTDELRDHLRDHPKPPPVTVPTPATLSAAAAQLLLDSDSSSSDSSDSSSSSSDSSDEDDDDDKDPKRSGRKMEKEVERHRNPSPMRQRDRSRHSKDRHEEPQREERSRDRREEPRRERRSGDRREEPQRDRREGPHRKHREERSREDREEPQREPREERSRDRREEQPNKDRREEQPYKDRRSDRDHHEGSHRYSRNRPDSKDHHRSHHRGSDSRH